MDEDMTQILETEDFKHADEESAWVDEVWELEQWKRTEGIS